MASSLTRLHLKILLILALSLGVAGYTGYLFVRDLQLSTYEENVTRAAGDSATRINELLGQQRQALEKLARQPGIVMALARGTATARAGAINQIKSTLPDIVAVHLLARDDAGQLTSTDAIDPASLDYVQRTASGTGAVPPEFRALGTPTEHYDLVVPVRDASQRTLGYLLAGFSRTSLQAVIDQSLPPGAYLALQAPGAGGTAQTILSAGTVKQGNVATVTSALGNSRWTLVYEPADTVPAILAGNRIYYSGIIGLAALAIFIALLRLHFQTVNAVRHDIRSLIRMFRDLREGSVRVDYPMKLREFAEIFNYLRDRGQKLVEEKEKLKGMGLMDHLSQLGNRRHFEMRLKELFDASKSNGPSSVLIIDMDHFKAVNDKHGHDAGDALIVGFANTLRKVVRQTDVLARLGGDEFCIIYAYAPLAKATALVDRLRRQLPREIMLTKGVMHQLRWTGGLSAMHDKDTKPDDVLWRADQALLQAKQAGRNITRVYDAALGHLTNKKIIVS
jgi:diguanylate cyclase (GGDEF)-like protein